MASTATVTEIIDQVGASVSALSQTEGDAVVAFHRRTGMARPRRVAGSGVGIPGERPAGSPATHRKETIRQAIRTAFVAGGCMGKECHVYGESGWMSGPHREAMRGIASATDPRLYGSGACSGTPRK